MRSSARFVICSVLALSTIRTCLATSFVLVKVDDGYVLGGDSLRVYIDDNPIKQCKIRTHGDLALVVWGVGDDANPDLDLRSMSQPILDEEGTGVAIRDQELFQRVTQSREYLATLARYHQGSGWLFVRADSAAGHDVAVGHGGIDFAHYSGAITLGVYAEHTGAEQAIKKETGKHETVQSAAAFIRQTLIGISEREPTYVGPPFSIVHVTKTGITWVQHGACR